MWVECTGGISLIKWSDIVRYLDPSKSSSHIPSSVKLTLELEERNGSRVIIYFRYLMLLIFLATALLVSVNLSEVVINLSFVGSLFIFNLFHTVALRKGSNSFIHFFNYIAIVFDYGIFLGMVIYYYTSYDFHNFNFVLKNPILAFMVVPLVSTAIQFRLKLLLHAILIFIAIYVGLVSFAVFEASPTTEDWQEYVLGDKVHIVALTAMQLALGLILFLMVGYAIFRTFRMVERIGTVESHKAMLSRYFSPSVVDEITNNPEAIEVGQRQKVTILFSDIRGFTALSETMESDEIATLLTSIRRMQIQAVFNVGGTVDKFIGDAIMATFGTPRPSLLEGIDTWNAVECALQMLESIANFNLNRIAEGKREVKVGIGIHTGEVFAGNIGDEKHLEYTVIGDAVNTASRIESLCKVFKTELLVSDSVYQEVEGKVIAERMKLVRVKGKEKPLQVYKIASRV